MAIEASYGGRQWRWLGFPEEGPRRRRLGLLEAELELRLHRLGDMLVDEDEVEGHAIRVAGEGGAAGDRDLAAGALAVWVEVAAPEVAADGEGAGADALTVGEVVLDAGVAVDLEVVVGTHRVGDDGGGGGQRRLAAGGGPRHGARSTDVAGGRCDRARRPAALSLRRSFCSF